MANEIIIKSGLDIEDLKSRIYIVRGQQVMLDRDLAELYGVETRRLNEAVKRNIERFPEDFMFQPEGKELFSLRLQIMDVTRLRSQIATLNEGYEGSRRGQHTKYKPYVFTELGVAMLSSVLRSETAIQVNINIMRAFVAIRHAVASMQDKDLRMEQLSHRVDQMDASITEILHEQGDIRREQEEANAEMALQIEALNDALDQLREKPAPKRNKIGYKTTKE